MRVQLPKLAFFAALSFIAPLLAAMPAFAGAAKPSHKPELREQARSASHEAHRVEASSRHKSAPEQKRHEVLLRVRKEAPLASHESRIAERTKAERPQTPAIPAHVEDFSPTVDETPIQVHHNRKIHLTEETAPADAAPAPSAAAAAPTEPSLETPAPRQATLEDFMPSAAKPPAPPLAPADPAPDKPAPVAKAAAPIVRRLPIKPAPAPVVVAAAPMPPPVIMPALFTSRGRLIVPPALKGSREILLRQNEMADQDGLERVQDDDDLDRMRSRKTLVALPASPALMVDERLPANRRYCRPWTAQFLAALARAHYARFHTPLQVNSAVRTVEFQERLRYTNGNAAPADGETASPHLTGQAVDLAKHGLSMTEIAWMRGYLLPLTQQGKIDVEEEFQQACFHISVYKKYMPQPAPKRNIATHRSSAVALAAAIR